MRDRGSLSPSERDEVFSLLREELQFFWAWLLEELGGEYFVSDRERPAESLQREAEEFVTRRARSSAEGLWERDRYAFYDDAGHPSIYRFFEAEDLEISHYREDFVCEHFKLIEPAVSALGEPSAAAEPKYEHSFGVLLASRNLGWMYRLDFCEFCGLAEIWSTGYNPLEVAVLSERL